MLQSIAKPLTGLILGLCWVLSGNGTIAQSISEHPISQHPISQHRSQSQPSHNPEIQVDQVPLLRNGGQASLSQISTVITNMEHRWEVQYSKQLEVTFPDRPISPDQVATTLQDIAAQTGTRAGFIWVAPYDNYLALTFITPDGEPIYREVDVKGRNLRYVAQEFARSIVDPNIFGKRYLRFGRPLYQWIIDPLKAELTARNIDTLIFCMGGGLRTLPLAALNDGNQFLVEQYNLAIVPAFSLTDFKYESLKNAQVLAMGASEFQDQAPLPAVSVELETITQDLWKGEAFLNQEFTENNLLAQRQKQPFQIIHLATHADFQPGNLRNSYLQLWDSRLTLNQIDQLHLDSPLVDLLVLSACRTAIGDAQAELGFAGLAVKAGVRSALASLWYVSDTGTLGLMTEFYRQLKTAPTKAAALRQAQIAMLRGEVRIHDRQLSNLSSGEVLPENVQVPFDEDFSHPYYWAAFTLIGNPW
jgi:CHAT domain-containing protein